MTLIRRQHLLAAAVASAFTFASAHAQTTPDRVETRLGTLNFERGYPTAETTRKLIDEIDYQRAVQAYLWGYPAVSFESIRLALKQDFGADHHDMVIADNFARPEIPLVDGQRHHDLRGYQRRSRQVRPGGRGSPAGAIVGLIDDFWQRSATDVGLPGPHGDKGGKFLLVPPGYKGELPKEGYEVRRGDDEQLQRHGARHLHQPGQGRAERRGARQEDARVPVERAAIRSRTNSPPCPAR